MKSLIVTLLIFATFIATAQPTLKIKTDSVANFVDSVKVNFPGSDFNYMDPNQISSINVVKKDSHYPQGAIYITLKDHFLLNKILKDKKLSLGEIAAANFKLSKHRKLKVLYFVDDKVITDTTGFRIPSMFVLNVTATPAKELPYFKTTYPDAVLLKISTKPPVVYIRGHHNGD